MTANTTDRARILREQFARYGAERMVSPIREGSPGELMFLENLAVDLGIPAEPTAACKARAELLSAYIANRESNEGSPVVAQLSDWNVYAILCQDGHVDYVTVQQMQRRLSNARASKSPQETAN